MAASTQNDSASESREAHEVEPIWKLLPTALSTYHRNIGKRAGPEKRSTPTLRAPKAIPMPSISRGHRCAGLIFTLIVMLLLTVT